MQVSIVRNGLAFVNRIYGFNPILNMVQEKAKNARLGIWSEENIHKITVYINDSDIKYHLFTCKLVKSFRKCLLLKEALNKSYSPCFECNPPDIRQFALSTSNRESKYTTGPRGGEYYINSKGNKVYRKKRN